MKLLSLVAAAAAFLLPAAAQAAGTIDFNGLCASKATATQAACTNLSGTYGNSVTLAATNDANTKVLITAWQLNQATGAITTAFLGDYDKGLGVTGAGDSYGGLAGGGDTHQIDNVGGYTDFVMLQFNKAVHLTGATLNLYPLVGVTGMHGDLTTYNATAIKPAVWNGSLSAAGVLTSYKAAMQADTPGDATAGYRATNSVGYSQVWLVGSSSTAVTADRNDGFKLAGFNVTPQATAVPELGTWALMIAGFGATGAMLRRRRAAGLLAA